MIDVKAMPKVEQDRLAAATLRFLQRAIDDPEKQQKVRARMSEEDQAALDAWLRSRASVAEKTDRELKKLRRSTYAGA